MELNIISKLKDIVLSSQKKPFVMTIGGNSRSGKTTFANNVSDSLKKINQNVLVVSLDNWILSNELRKNEYNVFDRFRIKKINSDIKDLLAGKIISLNEYNALSRQTNQKWIHIRLCDNDVLIIEGVVALASDELREVSDYKIFIDIDETMLKQQVIEFYLWKGLSKFEIDELLRRRKKDEYDLIKENRHYADFIIRTEQLLED